MIKISQMPIYSGVLTSVYVPIIKPGGAEWENFRMLLSDLVTGGSGLRFGVATEDFVATENRDFDLTDAFDFIIHKGDFANYLLQESEISLGTQLANIYVQAAENKFAQLFMYGSGGTLNSRFNNGAGEQTSAAVNASSNGVTTAENAASLTAEYTDGDTAYTKITVTHDFILLDHHDLAGVVNTFVNTDPDKFLTTDASGHMVLATVPSGGADTTTASNGLTLVGSDVQLGGDLTQTTTIDATSSFYLLVTGESTYTLRATTTTNRAISGEATGAGIGVTGIAASGFAGIGVQGTADNASGIGVQGNSIAGTGVYGSTATGWAGVFSSEPASTNTAVAVLKIQRTTSGTAANNIGGYISFWMEYSSPSTTDEAARIGATFTDISARTSDLNFTTKNSNSATETMTLKGSGNLVLNTTGKAYGLKSPDGTVWYITVDNAGVLSTSTTAP